MSFVSITPFDYILLVVLLLFVLHGIWIGFQRQLPFALALVGSYLASGQYAGDLMPHLSQLTESPKVVLGALFLILLIFSTLVLKLIAALLGKIVQVKVVAWVDRFFLAVPLALLKGASLLVLVLMFVAASLPPEDHFFRDSQVKPYLKQAMKMARKGIRDRDIRKDLKPRKEDFAQQQDVETKEIIEINLGQQEAVSPSVQMALPQSQQSQQILQSLQIQEAQEMQGVQKIQEVEEDDPSSSTEIIH